jgi:hypothetical protein
MRIPKTLMFTMCAAFALAVIVAAQTGGNTPPAPQAGEHQMAGAKQPASPRGQATFTFDDGKKITVDYGRPYMRNRKIMGGLVPYDKVWRTGANEATSFVTEAPLNLGGTTVPAGKYTMYTIPSENGWKLIVNKQTGQWGTEYNQAQDLARIDMKTEKLDKPVDQFTISFDKRGPNAGVMKLEWENTSATVDFSEANAQ